MPIRRSLSLCVLLCAALALPAFSDEPWQGTYVYDGAGNIKAIGANHYVYDGAGRLIEGTAITPAQSLVRNFSYDAFGNLREMRDPLQVTQFGTDSSTNRMDAASRCVTGTCVVGQYDPEGHQIGGPVGYHYGYDSGDMMTSLDTGSRHEVYIYDANDQRIATVTGATTAPAWRYTLRDGGANVIREWTASGTSWSWTKDYVHRDGTLLASISDTEQRTHFHVDHLNTPRLLTDDEGRKVSIHTYWPFGLEANGSDHDAERRKYTGHERDLAGLGDVNDLDYMHARYYSPVAARFLSVDIAHGKPDHPQSWNRYAYAMNNPVRYVDPNGLEPLSPQLWLFYKRFLGADFSNADIHRAGFISDMLPKTTLGVTLGQDVHLNSSLDFPFSQRSLEVAGHELTHTNQFQTHGNGVFLRKYYISYAVNRGFNMSEFDAYKEIPFEQLADFAEGKLKSFFDTHPDILKKLQSDEALTKADWDEVKKHQAFKPGLQFIDGMLVYVSMPK